MHAAETVKGFAAIRSAEYRGVARAETYVLWAQDMLEAGLESAALLRLAVADVPYFTPDLKRLFDLAVEEAGIEPLSGTPALILHGQQVAADFLAGFIRPGEAGAMLAEIFTPELAPPGFGHWQQLDEASWCDYCRESFTGPDRTLDQAIVEEATKLLAIRWREQ